MEESDATQGMTRTGRIYTPGHLGRSSKEATTKQPSIEIGLDDLWRKVQARVLIYGGSSLNICPLTTLKRLGKDFHEIRARSMNVKPFDGSQKATIREIYLCLQMGPTWFDIEFQVLYISATYNILLGRPWIHAAGAVASTIQQAMKFKWNHQEVIIHGDESNPIYTNQTIPIIENKRRLGGETYHHIEHVNAVEKDKWWSNKIESILAWSGYEPSKGLGKKLQGITKPIQLKRHDITFGLGYPYTWQEYNDWSPPWRGPYYHHGVVATMEYNDWSPYLGQTFHQANTIWGTTEEEALDRMRNLFLEDEDMDFSVIIEEEEEEGLSIQTVEKGARRKNTLVSYEDIFAWSYDDMTDLSTSIVAHKLPTNPICPPVKQKLRKFKPDMSLKIKEEVTKQIKAKVLRVVEYLTWLANIILVSKKDVKVRGIELDPSKVKAIQELPPPKNKKDVMSFLGRINYINCFIAQSTVIWESIFKMLRKDAETSWTEDCQKAFDKIKEYLSTSPVLVPPEPGRPMLFYLSVLDIAFRCVLGQHDEIGRKEQAIYYLSEKFTPYEARYSLLQCSCYALTWTSQKLRHYFYAYTTYLISRMDPLKYIFQKPMPIEREDIAEAYDGWRMFFDGAANFKGVGIRVVWSRGMGYEEHQDTAILVSYAGVNEEIHKDRIQTCAQNSKMSSQMHWPLYHQ
ncbi:uncharacterized protein [Nicotiana sylvestris]|uniref:uncharacterized protein n=1 Tax=Nicotiana sylvestris TaxID=4096 RepID=UPI00388C9279